ncbi:hypothetical protein SUGI_0619870 [Cryptomeria japonica]|uniref:calcium-transporting ATPase 5, plasma membrane-type isoform X1 n=1 Tax=Cryptomeria japonica TaxID=3369 RepID=UPI002414C84D|nr:calcium-transporting ATPase 5, plasma membrane-type isoform X1 [Cryptomeria japonica]XP_057871379.2 calcium-transporting ATPase 5, plasma membrane-type isoform X1 [Cryptomeria japonica]XP_057871385.2 calcium-transporting ATPase 5, plasma membrane-type isoform X1 [Cryptomeria japonica]XP_057871392.2 calcium-transporting ATPase 5, plasma membrane-type isoform X1 [Cryptomeria japonica]XP_057871396.2 calcium-transporting ATPase 5, plasma membrane-type isoform X1 [Cryptomeria japonica]XP_0578714
MSTADMELEEDVFIIHKHENPERLKKWRQATLVLNATRRFRYTLNLEGKEEARNVPSKRVRASTQVIRAVQRFREAGARATNESPPPNGFGVGPRKLHNLIEGQELNFLQQLGGVSSIAKSLRSNLEDGLNEDVDDMILRKEHFGENNYPRKHRKNFFVFVWEAAKDTTLIILMFCAAVSLITGMTSKDEGITEGWYDGTSITIAILIVVFVTAISDYKQSLEFEVLNNEKKNINVQVVRMGRTIKVSIFDLVVGDVVSLNIGDQVPADGLLIKGHSLSIDESSLTGESEPVPKDSMHPFLLSGCKVADGYGLMLVTGVGLNTEWGQIMAAITEDTGEETPLQVRLNGTATFIGKVGLVVAALVFVVLFIRYFTDEYSKSKKANEVASSLSQIFAIAVVIVVIAVPEGLPLAVTLTLAYSMRKMMEDKSLVRHLSACETMGSATIICSDKTGTLTLNEMTVVRTWVAGVFRETKDIRMFHDNVTGILIEGIAQNCTGMVSSLKGKDPEVSGSATEKALLTWGLQIGMDFKSVRSQSTIYQMEAFNSIKKRAGIALILSNGDARVHWKGAAEVILDLCNTYLDEEGRVVRLNNEKVREVISEMAANSLRCIAFAYQNLNNTLLPNTEEHKATWKIPDKELTIIAIVGIKDPCRPGVAEAVSKCKVAGVKVCMVTGDNLITAISIARECGIYTGDGLAIEGSEFRNYNNEEMLKSLKNLQVLARSLPSDKLLLVQKLKENNEVVAVTGDGTNDAPALHEADIGLAMGIAGTEVAKESSDVIILDDNFLSVVKMVRWGRSVYANVQKFIQFQLTVNVAALGINFVASVSNGNVPLKTVQMLWINLIMDTLGALALATEPPTDDLMQKPSIGLRDPLVTNLMWRNILGQASFQLTVLLTLYYKGIDLLRLDGTKDRKDILRDTIIFNTFVFCQLFNEINARKPEDFNIFTGMLKNHMFICVTVLSAIFQVIMVEFLNKFAKTTKLSWKYWLFSIGIGFLSLPIGYLLKLINVPKKPFITTHKVKRKRRSREDPNPCQQYSNEQLDIEQPTD